MNGFRIRRNLKPGLIPVPESPKRLETGREKTKNPRRAGEGSRQDTNPIGVQLGLIKIPERVTKAPELVDSPGEGPIEERGPESRNLEGHALHELGMPGRRIESVLEEFGYPEKVVLEEAINVVNRIAYRCPRELVLVGEGGPLRRPAVLCEQALQQRGTGRQLGLQPQKVIRVFQIRFPLPTLWPF